MNTKDIFNPNNYTSKNMPLCEQFCMFIDDKGTVSDDMEECRKKYRDDTTAFLHSLSPEQSKLYDRYYDGEVEEYAIATREHFNMGMCLGARLMLELLGTQPHL